MLQIIILLSIAFSISGGPPLKPSYQWKPRRLSCENYVNVGVRCAIRLPEDTVDHNPGCFEELDSKNETRVYCRLHCEESDETTIEKKVPQFHRHCNMFYTYNLERRRKDWYLWRSGSCINTTIDFDVLCGTPTDYRAFYFKNAHLFEYDDAES